MRPRPVDRADRIDLVMMLDPAIEFSKTLMSELFLMFFGICGESLWISSRETFFC